MTDDAAVDESLAQCAREPITTPERIQSFGFLLATTSEWVIVRASANLEQFIGVPAREVLGRKLDTVLHPEALHAIRNRMLALYLTRGTERLFGLPLQDEATLFDLSVHQVDGFFVFEAEFVSSVDQVDAAGMVRTGLARLNAQPTLEAFHREAARQVRSMTGFDRIMIYRFAASGAGEVIAESAERGMSSYLGLHYPASDIPTQARALYLRNQFRIIADASSATIPLLALEPYSAAPLDMSLSVTRAVSPVHIEYLHNMGVAASLSISIVVDGALWGLIACHHRRARLPGFVVRTAAELLGQMYSLALEGRLRRIGDEEQRRLHAATERMVDSIVGDDALVSRAEWLQEAIHDIIACDGTAVSLRGVVTTGGNTPSEADIAGIVRRLVERNQTRIYCSDELAALYPPAAAFPKQAAGVLAIPISSSARDYILLFRREQPLKISWAGDPHKAVGGVERISPRKSFEVFAETVKGQSHPFSTRERHAAESIRATLIEINLRVSEHSEDLRKRSSERQEVIIAELNHRVRNVLSLIRGVVGQSRRDTVDMDGYVAALQGRILALARAHDRITRDNWSPAPLRAIFDDEIDAYVPTGEDRFVFQGSPVWLKPECFATLALVIHELVTNSIKYGSLSTGGKVEISVNRVKGEGLYLKWRERDGPPVKQPTRRGFGSVLIERTVPFDLQGTAELRYLTEGFEAAFFIPDVHIVEATPPAAPARIGNGADGEATGSFEIVKRPLHGYAVLLVEDNLVLALEAEDVLLGLGARDVVMASSIAMADKLLKAGPVSFALLDINLGENTSFALAGRLEKAGVPYLFVSGYGEGAVPQSHGLRGKSISKPYQAEDLRVAVARALEGFTLPGSAGVAAEA